MTGEGADPVVGATDELELREVETTGLALGDYAAVRSVGAAHHEVMEAHVLGVDLAVYAAFRIENSHRQALDEAGAPHSSAASALAAESGVTARELAQVRATHRRAIDTFWESLARRPGERPANVAVARVGDYLLARRANIPHDEALAFAMQVAAQSNRPSMRDLLLWARCRAAGMPPDGMFVASPRNNRQRLTGPQLDALAVALYVIRSLNFAFPPIEELIWLASWGESRSVDAERYFRERARGRSRRGALRVASAG